MSVRDIYTNSAAGLAVFGITSCAGEAIAAIPRWDKIQVGLVSLGIAAALLGGAWLFERRRARKVPGLPPLPRIRPRRPRAMARINGLRSDEADIGFGLPGPLTIASIVGFVGGVSFLAMA